MSVPLNSRRELFCFISEGTSVSKVDSKDGVLIAVTEVEMHIGRQHHPCPRSRLEMGKGIGKGNVSAMKPSA